jgi:hypothetical protein
MFDKPRGSRFVQAQILPLPNWVLCKVDLLEVLLNTLKLGKNWMFLCADAMEPKQSWDSVRQE